jgi:hypothetical protein
VIAELRGTAAEPLATGASPKIQTSGGLRAGLQAQVDLKKNDERQPRTPPVATPSPLRLLEPASAIAASQSTPAKPIAETLSRRDDPPHVPEAPSIEANDASEPAAERESVLEQFKQAMANGGLPKTDAPPPRVSRREQLAQVAEQPFVRRAMELFDVAPDKIRYSPPEGESN